VCKKIGTAETKRGSGKEVAGFDKRDAAAGGGGTGGGRFALMGTPKAGPARKKGSPSGWAGERGKHTRGGNTRRGMEKQTAHEGPEQGWIGITKTMKVIMHGDSLKGEKKRGCGKTGGERYGGG